MRVTTHTVQQLLSNWRRAMGGVRLRVCIHSGHRHGIARHRTVATPTYTVVANHSIIEREREKERAGERERERKRKLNLEMLCM
jgi:hypothetical protein